MAVEPPTVVAVLREHVDEAAARIGGKDAAPQLARGLRDSRAVVRAAALREIGRLSGKYQLDLGATSKDEKKVWGVAVAWLKSEGVWPE